MWSRLDNNETIATCEIYKYLGVNFNKESTEDAEIKSSITKTCLIRKVNVNP